MNPFANPKPITSPSLPRRLAARPATVVFLSCLMIGVLAVVWRAVQRAEKARAQARDAALARSTAVELQFSQMIAAAEVLGALARQSGGAVPNFQQVAADLLAAHPGVASLELQPNGVVSDLVPRAGLERALGFNVLNDAAHQPGARAALQARRLTVAGPLNLYRGEQGLVARVPVFQRARDRREVFWGFVAVSMRLPEALARARVDELFLQGYDYVLYAPQTAQPKPVVIAARGWSSFQKAVQQPVRVQNLEFWLAVQPRDGWGSWKRIALELLGAGFVSALLGLLVMTWRKWHDAHAFFREANGRLTRETVERKQAQDDSRAARESADSARTQLKQTQAALQQAEAAIVELQSRLEEAARTAQETVANSETQLQRAAQTLAELQGRLDAAENTAKAEAEARAAALGEAERNLRELEARAQQAERAEARVAELAALLVSAQTRGSAGDAPVPSSDAPDETEATTRTEPDGDFVLGATSIPFGESPTGAGGSPALPTLPTGSEPTPAAEPVVEPGPVVAEEKPVAISKPRSSRREEAQTSMETEPPHVGCYSSERGSPVAILAEPVVAEPSGPLADAAPAMSRTAQAGADSSASSPTAEPVLAPRRSRKKPVPPAPVAEPPPKPKPAKRKKARKDDQMSLFGEAPATPEPAALAPAGAEVPAPNTATVEQPPETSEPAAAPAMPLPPCSAEASSPAPASAESAEAGPSAALSSASREAAPPEESTAPAPKAAELNLPEIDGLDTADGLARSDGDPKFYLRSLRQFVEQQAGAAEKIRDLLVQGEPAAAEQAAAALKGVAEGIGATALPSAAAEVEKAIRKQSDPAEIETLWAALEKALNSLVAELKSAVKPKEEKPAPARRLPPPPPVNPAQLRKAVNQILPLLTDRDPGAKDCLKDNRTTFRSAFTPEAYVEFAQQVKAGDFSAALEHLKKAAKKHGISV